MDHVRGLPENGLPMQIYGLTPSSTQLYESLLQTHPEAAQRMIFMTSDILSETTERFLREHGKTCLAKPFSLVEFQAAVARMFQSGSGGQRGQTRYLLVLQQRGQTRYLLVLRLRPGFV